MIKLNAAMIERMQNTVAKSPQHNAEVRAIMADTSILCLSETYDNLLMWSHYAHKHTGVVVEFLSLPEVDSPLIMAQSVRYSQKMPQRNFADFPSARQVSDAITLTKAKVWEYEEEWRIVTTLRNKGKSYEILPFAPEEVCSVYLGCKISKEDKDHIVQITRDQYSDVTIFQARKHETEFRLIFEEVL